MSRDREQLVRVVVADRASADPVAPVLAVEDLVAVRHAGLERDRDRERLERAAGLERVDERARAVRGGVLEPEAVGVEARRLGEREDLAVARIERDQRRVARAGLAQRFGERLLGEVLQLEIERERDRLTRACLGRLGRGRQHAAAAVAFHVQLGARAAQLAVEQELDAGQPAAVAIREAEDRSAERSVGVEAAALAVQVDARQRRARARAPQRRA